MDHSVRSEHSHRPKGLLRRAALCLAVSPRGLPRQFWLLVAGTFFFYLGIDVAVPLETLYLTQRLEISMATVGLVLGLSAFVGVPFQIPGGALVDRLGRRPLMTIGIVATMQLFLGLAFAQALWLIVLVTIIEAIFGWSMYQTASNAMIADTVPFERRGEAYSLIRTAANAGAATGPLVAALMLSRSGSFRLAFMVGAGICGLFLLMVLLLFKETGPGRAPPAPLAPSMSTELHKRVRVAEGVAAGTPDDHVAEGTAAHAVESLLPTAPQPMLPVQSAETACARNGYARLLRDVDFLLFVTAALLPMFCLAQIWVTLPVLLTDLHSITPQTWGLLLSLYSMVSAVIQYPLVRALRRHDLVGLIGLGCLLMGTALGGLACASYGWPTVLLMLMLAAGVVLFLPLVHTVVSQVAPVDLRGHYMGVWTIVYTIGYGLGPLLGGQAMHVLGPRRAYLVVAAVGACGALAFWLLAAARRRRAFRKAGGIGAP